MNLSVIIFLICFFKMTMAQAPIHQDYFVIRNVGQGLWTTRILNDTCEHYDFGGELLQTAKLKKQFILQCFNKLNILHLSHGDWDHYSFLNLIIQNSKQSCWGTRPPEKLKNEPLGIPYCHQSGRIVFYDSESSNRNDRSIVQQMNHFLIPGDSSIKMEKIWSQRLPRLKPPIKYLLLGHHGSRNATGDALLDLLPQLRLAIASARFQKYRHPHWQTIKKLRKHQVPLIKTEDWGDIQINY